MYIKFCGEAVKEKSVFRYGCNITDGVKSYTGYIVSNKREFQISDGQDVILRSQYVCDSIFQKLFSCGYFKYVDSKNEELFQICPTSSFALFYKVRIGEKEIKLPRKNTFEMDLIGFRIETKHTIFNSSVYKEYEDIGLALSYFCWLRQQVWNNIS